MRKVIVNDSMMAKRYFKLWKRRVEKKYNKAHEGDAYFEIFTIINHELNVQLGNAISDTFYYD